MVTMQLEGADNLERTLASLEKTVAKKLARKGVRAAAGVTLPVCKAMAASVVGGRMGSLLAAALEVRAAKKQRPGSYMMRVQHSAKHNETFVDVAADGTRNYIPNAIEYGHAGPGGGGGAKTVQPMPYMRPGLESTKLSAANRMIAVLWDGIKGEFNRAG